MTEGNKSIGNIRTAFMLAFSIIAMAGRAEIYTVDCVEDTFVQSNKPTENFGNDGSLIIRNTSSGFSRVPYLKFVVSGLQGNVTGVKLKLYSDTLSSPIKAYAISDNSWTELGLTWDTRPAFGAEIGSATAMAASWFEIDIPGAVTADDIYSFALDEQSNSVARLSSREGGDAPYLEITTDYVSLINQPPVFNADPITDTAQLYIPYSGSIASTATDPGGGPLAYSKVSGPGWLDVRVNGDLRGTPDAIGVNSFTVKVEKPSGLSDTATLDINVASVVPAITVVNRAGTDVTAQTLIDSDHIHINALASVSLTQGSFTYKYLEQASEPTLGEWSAVSAEDFWHDLWFYRKPVNQWVQLNASDIDSSTVSAVYGLLGGTLTAPPDDPILPIDYVDAMGPGLIVEADSDKDEVIPEISTIEMKKAGFNHMRMHIGRLLRDNVTPNTPANNPDYFDLLDRWIEQTARHGMYCHIGNKGNSLWQVSNVDDGSQAWKDSFAAEIHAWWEDVADHCKFNSHRLAYHLFLETGGNDFMKDVDALNAFHDDATENIRLLDASRLLIYPPPSINDVSRLPEMTFPYADQDPGDGIPTGSGNYWFSEFHRFFASGRAWITEKDLQIVEENLNEAIDWIAAKNVPLIMSAVRPTNSNTKHNEYISHRIRYINHLHDLCDSAPLPIRITWLTYDNYNFEDGSGWKPGMRTLLEVMNRQGTADGSDPDGDQVSTSDEINIHGTNPYLADSDQDNILDTYECTMAIFDPLDPADGDPLGDPSTSADFDGDGMDNAWEMLNAIKWGDDTLTATHLFNPTDSSDALADEDGDGVVNIWERVMRVNPLSSASIRKGDDATDDWDGDSVNNLNEINANTWPLDDSDEEFDVDYDEIRSDVDPLPFIHDEGHVVSYAYDSNATDLSSQGANNAGTLLGGMSVSGGIANFDGVDDFINVPTTDLGSSSNRSVNLHFWAAQLGGYQILYKEGGTSSGLSIYLDGNKLWMGAWNLPQEQFVELGSVNAEQWHGITLVFNAGNLSGYVSKNNAWISSAHRATSIATVGDPAFRAALGGSDDATRVWNTGASASITVTGEYFSGYLDDTQIYTRELSENDAALLSRNDLYPAKQPVLPATLPYFTADPLDAGEVFVGDAFVGTLAGTATDPNGDPLTFSKVDGPAWLSVASGGALSGTPVAGDTGLNRFTVQVADGVHGAGIATLEIQVTHASAPLPPFTVVEDTFVQINKGAENFGALNSLTIRNSSSGYSRIPYLKFNVSGLAEPVALAVLRVYSSTLTAPVKAYAIADNSWTEMGLTWNTRPAFGAEIGNASAVAGTWFEVDVTDYITGNGTFSLALDEQNNIVAQLSSREGGNAAYLEIRTQIAGDTPESLYSDWADLFPTLGSATNLADNPDGDLLNNLGEYALGGDPTNSAHIGYIPEAVFTSDSGTSYFEYIHAQRNDAAARGLTYSLELSTNLVSNVWTNGNAEVVGTGTLDSEFDSVTNHVPVTDGDQEFIRLRIKCQ